MKGVTRESVIEDISTLLSEEDSDERIRMISDLKAALQRELLKIHIDVPEMKCPDCGSTEYIRYGKTAAGTQRWQCKSCGSVRCHRETGSILFYTKLDESIWMDFASCFVDRLTCDEVAERLGVCHKTAWFMRLRTMQAVFPNLPSFQVKAGNGVEIDEIYFRESFKGTRFDGMQNRPREPRQDGPSSKSGISSEQICVITAYNDTNDFFFDVCCRGPLTAEIGMRSLENRICEGAIVNTDENRAYPKVMAELKVAVHTATNSRDHTGLGRINEIHGDIRTFFSRFKGVSTRWLHLYLGWYKWRRAFRSDCGMAAKHIVSGDYDNKWKSLKNLGSPFRDAHMNQVKC